MSKTKTKKAPENLMSVQEFGMSSEFTRNSIGNIPFFRRNEEGQLVQNLECQTTGPDFLKRYDLYRKGKPY